MKRFLSSMLLLTLLAAPLHAQRSRAELPAIVTKMGLDLALPVLEGLRLDSGSTVGYQPYDLAWQHTRGKFSLRYQLVPAGTGVSNAPHVYAGRLVTHNARNQEGDYIGRWRAGQEDLNRLNAEWAYFWDYAPKLDLGEWRRCYQASYYHSGYGLVNVWLLYNDPDYLHSDWVYVLPFATEIPPKEVDN